MHVDINSKMFLLMSKFSRTTFELKEMKKKTKTNAKQESKFKHYNVDGYNLRKADNGRQRTTPKSRLA
jgi:hypothetical protein